MPANPQTNTVPAQSPVRPNLYALGDIELGNRVVSVNGMRILSGSGAPSNSIGNWHAGDQYTDYTNHNTWIFNGTAWVPSGMHLLFDAVAATNITDITWSSIPQNYKGLKLVIQARSNSAVADDQMRAQFNGDTAANYDFEFLGVQNTASSASVGVASTSMFFGNLPAASSARAAIAATLVIDIPNYAGTTFEKSLMAFGGSADSTAANSAFNVVVNSWRSTAAITSIKLFANVGTNLITGTRATLYGLP